MLLADLGKYPLVARAHPGPKRFDPVHTGYATDILADQIVDRFRAAVEALVGRIPVNHDDVLGMGDTLGETLHVPRASVRVLDQRSVCSQKIHPHPIGLPKTWISRILPPWIRKLRARRKKMNDDDDIDAEYIDDEIDAEYIDDDSESKTLFSFREWALIAIIVVLIVVSIIRQYIYLVTETSLFVSGSVVLISMIIPIFVCYYVRPAGCSNYEIRTGELMPLKRKIKYIVVSIVIGIMISAVVGSVIDNLFFSSSGQ